MEQKKILATLAMVGTLCAAHSAVPNNTHESNAKKVTNINEKLLVKNTSNINNSNSSHHINTSADKVSDLKATGKVSSNSNTVNVRNNPHDSSIVLGKLNKNSTIQITGKTNNWYKIKFNGSHGYIHSTDVATPDEELATKTNFAKPSLLASSMTGTVYNLYQGISLHVRSGAGLNYSIIGDLHNGNTVNIINQIGNWYEINYNGQIAYVYAAYVNTGSQATLTSSSNTSNGTVCNLSSGVYLHVRTGPSLDDRIIAYLDEGETVNILGKSGNWYKINYNGQIAYVYSSYVNDNSTSNNTSKSPTNTSNSNVPTTTSTGTICNLNSGASLHVRSGAGLNYSIIADLDEGTTIKIIKQVGNWYEINYNGQIAYVYSTYVATNNQNSNSNNDKKQSPSIPTTNYTGTVCNLSSGVYLHVRTGPSLDNSIIAYLNEGDNVNIIKQIGNWYEINYNGQIAYVYSTYVNAKNSNNNNNNSANSNNNSIPSTTSHGTVCNLNAGEGLHVRTGAGLNYNIIADIYEGSTVNIIKQIGNWYEINYNGQIAYVYSTYVNANNNDGNSNNSTNSRNANNTNNGNSNNNSVPSTTSQGTVCNLSSGVVLHVRSGAGLDYSIIADLNEGTTVNIIKQVGNWYEINYNGQIAYVYSTYVNTNNSSGNSNNNNNNSSSNNNNSVPNTAYEGTVCNLSYGVNLHVRSGAGLDYNIIAKLNEGATVNIIKKIGNWYEINYNGQVAYVYAYYVSTSNNTANNNTSNNSNSNNNNNNNNNGSKSTTGNNPYHLDFGKNSTVITTNYPGTLQQYINAQYNNWPYYSRSQYKNYINPASANNIYQFLTINKFRNINVNKLNDALSGDGVLSGQGQGFYDAAKEFNIDPVYLVAQCLLETGRGTSYLASGVTIDKIANPKEPIYSNGVLVGYHMTPLPKPVTVYNLFGIGAYNNTAAFPNRALILGTTYAYTHGWTSVPSAIAGAAQFVSQCYINNGSFGQITPYEFRYNPVLANIWHQYATTVWYGSSIGNLMKNLSYIYSTGDEFTFNIPVFKN